MLCAGCSRDLLRLSSAFRGKAQKVTRTLGCSWGILEGSGSRRRWKGSGGSWRQELVDDLARNGCMSLKTLFMTVCECASGVLKAPRKQDEAQKRKIKPVETNF